MKFAALKPALLALAVLGSTAAAPIASALAETNNLGNATVAHTAINGAYDTSDAFKDRSGHPVSGWQYLIFPANSNG